MTASLNVGSLLKAASLAARKHAGQTRKDNEHSPYITHPLAVARVLWDVGEVRDTCTLTAAILHDTVEDTETTPEEIREAFGQDVLDVVLEVTDDKTLPKIERKRRQVLHAPHLSSAAKTLKLGDKIVNCRDILAHPPADWNLQRRRNYIQWGADVIAGMRGTNQALEDLFDRIVSEAEEKLEFTLRGQESLPDRPWGPQESA